MDHPIFEIGMTDDAVTMIINHTPWRDFIFPNKIIAVDDLGLVVQKYITDVTLTMARRGGEYIVIEVKEKTSKEDYEKIGQADPTPYLEKHYGKEDFFPGVVEAIKDQRDQSSKTIRDAETG